jgi:hypothetical protein
MYSADEPHREGRPKGRPHLVLKTHPGWHWNSASNSIEHLDGRQASLATLLAKDQTLTTRVPSASHTAKHPDERELSRYYNILLSPKETPNELIQKLASLPCTESVHHPPDINLPL